MTLLCICISSQTNPDLVQSLVLQFSRRRLLGMMDVYTISALDLGVRAHSDVTWDYTCKSHMAVPLPHLTASLGGCSMVRILEYLSTTPQSAALLLLERPIDNIYKAAIILLTGKRSRRDCREPTSKISHQYTQVCCPNGRTGVFLSYRFQMRRQTVCCKLSQLG